MSNRIPFLIIDGGQERSSSWLQLPATAIGRAHQSRDILMPYRIAQEDARKALQAGQKQPLLNLWSGVIGEIPPVPNAEKKYAHLACAVKRGSLVMANACFRGLKRPVGDDDRGFDVVAFVTKPTVLFTYDPSQVCVIKPMEIPSDMVMVTYVRLDVRGGRTNARVTDPDASVGGCIIRWRLVESDPANALLPVDFKERYRRHLW